MAERNLRPLDWLSGLPFWMLGLTLLMALNGILYWVLGPVGALDVIDIVFGLTHPRDAGGAPIVPPTVAFREAFTARPWTAGVHYVFMPLALLLGAVQFSDRVRMLRPAVHRWVGRVFFGCMLLGVGGMAVRIFTGDIYGGPLSVYQFSGMFVTTLICTGMGLFAALAGDFATHGKWMWRTYLIIWSSSVVSRLLILFWVPFAWASMDYDPDAYTIPYNVALLISWAFPLLISDALEDLASRRRAGSQSPKSVPGLGLVRDPSR